MDGCPPDAVLVDCIIDGHCAPAVILFGCSTRRNTTVSLGGSEKLRRSEKKEYVWREGSDFVFVIFVYPPLTLFVLGLCHLSFFGATEEVGASSPIPDIFG